MVGFGFDGRLGTRYHGTYTLRDRSLHCCFLVFNWVLSILVIDFNCYPMLRQPREQRRDCILNMHLSYIANITIEHYKQVITFYLRSLTRQPAAELRLL
jgi:hypothetical protein